MSKEDPISCSSTASCLSPGKYAPCQPSLLPSSALPGPFPWQNLEGQRWGRVQTGQGVPDAPCCWGARSPLLANRPYQSARPSCLCGNLWLFFLSLETPSQLHAAPAVL